MGADVADVAENKTDEHEEETDQRERRGRADHLWKTSPPVSIKYSFRRTPAASQTHDELVSSPRLLHVALVLHYVRSFPSSPLF